MFGFDKLITPKIINVLYGITMLLLVVAAIITFVNGKAAGALVLLLCAVFGNDSNLLIVFYVQIMPDDFVMQLHRF